jgi:hypothetical protein
LYFLYYITHMKSSQHILDLENPSARDVVASPARLLSPDIFEWALEYRLYI